MRNIIIISAISGLFAVAFGAFGAHALKDTLNAEMHVVYEKAVIYQIFHTLAMIACGILLFNFPAIKGFRVAAYLFMAGIIIFSGSLYIYSISGIVGFAIATPVGGLCFMAGWALLATSALKIKPIN